MPAFLVPVESGHCLIPLEKAIVLIGRQADCDVSLTNSRKISRKHCCVAQVNNKFIIRDLGSTNGVYLNGQRIQKEAEIEMGDALIIGDVHFKLVDEIPYSANVAGAKNTVLPTNKFGISKAVPQIPNSGRTVGVQPKPQFPNVNSAEENDDPNAKSPNTLEGIRRYRSKR